jgi:hypothetical protein
MYLYIINTGEPQSAFKYHDQLIENLLDQDDHIICVLLIKHSLKVQCMLIKLHKVLHCFDSLIILLYEHPFTIYFDTHTVPDGLF